MAWIEQHQLLVVGIVAAVIVLLVILRYRDSFRAKAEVLGSSLEVEGRGSSKDPASPARTPSHRAVDPTVSASGERSVAIGQSADRATIITGDRQSR